MMRKWTLLELLGRFPDAGPYPTTVLRCVRAARTTGRHEGATPPHEVAEVSLGAWPASAFLLTCLHKWPASVALDEEDALDAAVLRGLLQGAAAVAHPPWHASIVCETIEYVAGRTTPAAVERAMASAVESLVSRGQWVVERSVPDEPA